MSQAVRVTLGGARRVHMMADRGPLPHDEVWTTRCIAMDVWHENDTCADFVTCVAYVVQGQSRSST